MAKPVDLAQLADALADFRFAYLITVDDDHRAHTTTVTPTLQTGVLDIGPVGRHSRANLARRGDVSLVWPPREVGDYSLIVDGQADLPDDPAGSLRVTPTRAVLHRPVILNHSDNAKGCVYDCVELAEG